MNHKTNVAHSNLIAPICAAYPDTQAIYLYGTWGTQHQRDDSDIDVAVLLPHDEAKKVDSWEWLSLSAEIAKAAGVEHADLVNIRCVDTSFQIEILRAERDIYCTDDDARIEFEALVLSMYQRLNYERARIRGEIIREPQITPAFPPAAQA